MPRRGEPAFVFCVGSGGAFHPPPRGPCAPARSRQRSSWEARVRGSILTPLGANPPLEGASRSIPLGKLSAFICYPDGAVLNPAAAQPAAGTRCGAEGSPPRRPSGLTVPALTPWHSPPLFPS